MEYLRKRAVTGLLAVGFFALFVVSLKAGPVAYAGLGGGNFGTIDLSTGAFTSLGNLGQTPAGLGVFDGSLYAESYNGLGTLYSVNPSDGALSAIGNSDVYFAGGFGSTLSGLYGLGYAPLGSTLDLFSIDPTDGSASDLGSTGLSLGSWRDLSTNSGTLYFGNGADLYSLNTTNGSPTLVGAFGGVVLIGAMVTEGGTLYGGDEGNETIDTINTTTGTATITPGSSASDIWALAPDPLATSATPEPATWSLFAGALGLLAFAGRRRTSASARQ